MDAELIFLAFHTFVCIFVPVNRVYPAKQTNVWKIRKTERLLTKLIFQLGEYNLLPVVF